jgi:hypothetical protein
VAIVVPLLRRADRREGFWEHAAITLLVPAMLVLAWTAVLAVARAAARHGRWRRRRQRHRGGRPTAWLVVRAYRPAPSIAFPHQRPRPP